MKWPEKRIKTLSDYTVHHPLITLSTISWSRIGNRYFQPWLCDAEPMEKFNIIIKGPAKRKAEMSSLSPLKWRCRE